MAEKVVIRIRKAKDTDYSSFGFGGMACCCSPAGFMHNRFPGHIRRRARTQGSDRMRSALDSLEQMYEDLFGGD
jgi:hypothetical protein